MLEKRPLLIRQCLDNISIWALEQSEVDVDPSTSLDFKMGDTGLEFLLNYEGDYSTKNKDFKVTVLTNADNPLGSDRREWSFNSSNRGEGSQGEGS